MDEWINRIGRLLVFKRIVAEKGLKVMVLASASLCWAEDLSEDFLSTCVEVNVSQSFYLWLRRRVNLWSSKLTLSSFFHELINVLFLAGEGRHIV